MTAQITWFIEPKNSAVNNALAQELGEEDFLRNQYVVLARGLTARVNLWRCQTYDLVGFLIKSQSELNMRHGPDFQIFNQTGNGQIRLISFLKKKQRKPTKRTKQSAKQ